MAAPPIPQQPNWYVGQQVNSADLNQIPAGINWLNTQRPICVVYANSATQLNQQQWTTVILQNVNTDSDGGWNLNTNAYTAQTAGWYLVVGCVVFNTPPNPNNTGSRATRIVLNGNPVAGISAHAPSNFNTGVSLQRSVYMGVGDTLAIQGFQDSGQMFHTATNNTECPFIALAWYSE